MENKPTIRELLDACRADHHDSQRPELAAELAPLACELQASSELRQAAEKSERFDRNVRAALDDVALPAGLADRLLAGCEAALVAPATTSTEPVAEQTSKRFSRRQMIAIFSAAASLLILLAGGYQGYLWFNQKPGPVSADQLAMSANSWCDQSGAAAKWLSSPFPTAQFPPDRAVIVAPSRWVQLDKTTVVYELLRRGDSKPARLFVHRTDRPHQVKEYPSTRLSTSGIRSMNAWQRNGYVYILEFSDPDQRIKDFVRSTPPI